MNVLGKQGWKIIYECVISCHVYDSDWLRRKIGITIVLRALGNWSLTNKKQLR